MVGGQSDSAGKAASSAASIRRRRASSPAARSLLSDSPVAAGERRLLGAAARVEDEVAPRVLEEQLDRALRLLQLGVAQAGETDALLVEDERLLEGQLALLQLLNDLVQLLERGLEGGRLFGGQASSFPVTCAASAPDCTRMRSASPTATSAASRTRWPEPSKTSAYPRERTASGERESSLPARRASALRRAATCWRARPARRPSWVVTRARRSAIWRSQRKASSWSPARR